MQEIALSCLSHTSVLPSSERFETGVGGGLIFHSVKYPGIFFIYLEARGIFIKVRDI